MNFKRGLIAGLIGTVTGGLLPVILIGGYTLFYWFWHDSPAMDRKADLAYWWDYGGGTVIGMALYFGLSAWATYTPSGKYRFASTLGILTLGSLLLMIFLSVVFRSSYPIHKGGVHQTDWSGILFFSLPPLLAAWLIVLFRWSRWLDMEDAPQPPSPHT